MTNPQHTATPEAKSAKTEHHQLHPPERSIAIWGPLLGVTILALLIILIAWHHIQSVREQRESSQAASQITVNVINATRNSKPHELILPGDVQAYLSTTIYARTNGYIKKWYTDIGARVNEGQLMAEIEAPDVDAQYRQSVANLGQAKANLEIAHLTFQRDQELLQKKVISDQESDQARTSYNAAQAAVKAGQANVENLQVEQNFQKIVAPFTGVVTRRNFDVGALVSAGSGSAGTLLFNLAQSDPLRIYVNVPQNDAPAIHVGMKARVLVPERPDKDFEGTVVRTAGALDPASRTLLTEVDIPNPDGILYAGMYGQVKFTLQDPKPPFLVPANAFMFHPEGQQIALVTKENRIHWQTVQIGRDFGTSMEVVNGLHEGQLMVMNPNDDLTEGVEVQVKHADKDAAAKNK